MSNLKEIGFTEVDVDTKRFGENHGKKNGVILDTDEIQPSVDSICRRTHSFDDVAKEGHQTHNGQFEDPLVCSDDNISIEAMFGDASSCTVSDISSVSLQNIAHLDDTFADIGDNTEKQLRLSETMSNVVTEFIDSVADTSLQCNELRVCDGLFNSTDLKCSKQDHLVTDNDLYLLSTSNNAGSDVPAIDSTTFGIISQSAPSENCNNSCNSERLVINAGIVTCPSTSCISSKLRLSPGIARRILGHLSTEATVEQQKEIDNLRVDGMHISYNNCAHEAKSEALDIQNEYDYIKYLRTSNDVNEIHGEVEVNGESEMFIQSQVSCLTTVSDGTTTLSSSHSVGDMSSQLTDIDAGSKSAVKHSVPKLPLVEDGLSSGHNSDADDNSYYVVENNLPSPKVEKRASSLEKNRNGPNGVSSNVEVEKAIHEIKLAIQKSKNQSMVLPTIEYLASSTENDSCQPVWITRLVKLDSD